MSIYFIGFRGVGKTTIGAALADRWGWNFLDLDHKFEVQFGPINEFVEKNGISLFREKEFEVLTHTTNVKKMVIATGGGVVDYEPSRKFLLSANAPKVWLEADLEQIWSRLESPEKRKVLDLQSFEQMEQLFLKRKPFYHKIATFRVPSRDITDALGELEVLREQLWQYAL